MTEHRMLEQARRRPAAASACRSLFTLIKGFATGFLLWVLTVPAVLLAAEPPGDAELIAMLRAGGFNIYFRHAQTDWSQSDNIVKAGDWTSCDPERVRQLSDEGRETARAVGNALRALRIPVGRVYASPYCRAVETARYMELGPVTVTDEVMNLRVADYFGGRGAIVERARALLSTPPATGTNAVVVAHGNVAREATPVYPGEGEGVIFRPLGKGEFVLVDRVDPARWSTLAAGSD